MRVRRASVKGRSSLIKKDCFAGGELFCFGNFFIFRVYYY